MVESQASALDLWLPARKQPGSGGFPLHTAVPGAVVPLLCIDPPALSEQGFCALLAMGGALGIAASLPASLCPLQGLALSRCAAASAHWSSQEK